MAPLESVEFYLEQLMQQAEGLTPEQARELAQDLENNAFELRCLADEKLTDDTDE